MRSNLQLPLVPPEVDPEKIIKKVKKEDFQLGNLVLKWDAPRQDKGKHGKFEALWIGPFKISEVFPNNTFKL
jgi:hypothetical protein